MTAIEFNNLQMGDKADVLWPAGMFIDEHLEPGKCMTVIYKMPHFFVEVKFDVNTNNITDIYALEADQHFEAYLNNVSLFHWLN